MNNYDAKPFKMSGFTYPGQSPILNDPAANLLAVVPNKEAYDKLSDADKAGFDAAAKGNLPTKRVKKEGPLQGGMKHITYPERPGLF